MFLNLEFHLWHLYIFLTIKVLIKENEWPLRVSPHGGGMKSKTRNKPKANPLKALEFLGFAIQSIIRENLDLMIKVL